MLITELDRLIYQICQSVTESRRLFPYRDRGRPSTLTPITLIFDTENQRLAHIINETELGPHDSLLAGAIQPNVCLLSLFSFCVFVFVVKGFGKTRVSRGRQLSHQSGRGFCRGLFLGWLLVGGC